MPYVTTEDGVRINVVEKGRPDGRPIVFVHGLGSSCQAWEGVVAAPGLADRYRLIAFDLRGHGRSDTVLKPELLTADSIDADALERVAAVAEATPAESVAAVLRYVIDFRPFLSTLGAETRARITAVIADGDQIFDEAAGPDGLGSGGHPYRPRSRRLPRTAPPRTRPLRPAPARPPRTPRLTAEEVRPAELSADTLVARAPPRSNLRNPLMIRTLDHSRVGDGRCGANPGEVHTRECQRRRRRNRNGTGRPRRAVGSRAGQDQGGCLGGAVGAVHRCGDGDLHHPAGSTAGGPRPRGRVRP
ncbi:alpha/beta fold hydrolase [Streptomyces sp. NPDC001493]